MIVLARFDLYSSVICVSSFLYDGIILLNNTNSINNAIFGLVENTGFRSMKRCAIENSFHRFMNNGFDFLQSFPGGNLFAGNCIHEEGKSVIIVIFAS